VELRPEQEQHAGQDASLWRDPFAWFARKNLSRGYWVFFTAAFFYDAGLSIYVFLFNLFLLDLGFNERAMGWIGGAMTLGTLVGTLPAGAVSRRIGLRPLLVVLFLTVPALCVLRTLWMWEPAQIVLAFLAGLMMSIWFVCFMPAVARLTTEKNRTTGFSLIFSVGIGTSMLGGIVCGYLRQWLRMAGILMRDVEVKRMILILSCGIAFAGIAPVLRLAFRAPSRHEADTVAPEAKGWLREWKLSPFLLRFLPAMALWGAVVAAFTPFANVYLSRNLHIPMVRIGWIFSIVQVMQFCMGLMVPILFRYLGLVNGIVATQITAAVVLGCLAGAHDSTLAIILYLIFSAAQWASSPGIYNLLMSETPDRERSNAAAMAMFGNALAGSIATAAAGVLFTRFGYPPVLLGIAVLALGVALLFWFLMPQRQRTALVSGPCGNALDSTGQPG
jgi:MFS family permease